MHHFQPHQIIRFQKRHKKLQKFFKRMGFTGNIPFSLDFGSLSARERVTFINEIETAYGFVETLPPRAVFKFCDLIDADADTTVYMVLMASMNSNCRD
ncbi:unnamed protein product [Adineta steineri]|uniref:Uncharacterized protein n=1 Tax=Adineta steineri TaxID=433720 RepID=A0A813VEV7_9BILA|nr:unnamed protein product [Adineta steineri]CAF0919164.1 unnamed protein product [Adineta steineri]